MSSSSAYTYDQLIQALSTWLEDSSTQFTGRKQRIVSLGESKLATDLNLSIFDRVKTGSLTSGSFIQTIKESTWQGTRSLFLRAVGGSGPRSFVEQRTYEWCQDYEPDETATGKPLYFSEYEETKLFMVPAPDANYAFELLQTQQPTPLTAANQSTWLSKNVGDLLLYACLIESEKFLKSEPEFVQRWKDAYDEGLQIRRLEFRNMIRSDYSPVKNAARTVEDRP